MFRFSRSTNNLLLFHTPKDSTVYLHRINENRYSSVAKGRVNGWDLFAHGWVKDTVQPSAPTALNLSEATAHMI
jgi:hypothetical protein